MSSVIDTLLKTAQIQTPLGPMTAIGDDVVLYLLEYSDRLKIEREISQLKERFEIVPGRAKTIDSIEEELNSYFQGTLKEFKTPLSLRGTPFQTEVWKELRKIPFAQTRSYRDLAVAIGKPTAFRAVALANAANQLPIIIPCHRVINSGGEMGGYSGGLERKKWLLDHEKKRL